jgi:acyl CoA:acetate/3-ketoacid CoA transferase alpha subunit
MQRKTVVVDEETALDHLENGMTVALSGFITSQHSMIMIRGMASGAEGSDAGR